MNISTSNNYLFDLSKTHALLEFSGNDAKSFLQGQLTNDINEVTNEFSQLSGYCNPKGRLLALFHIFSIADKIYLQFPIELLAKIQKRLQMFIMMSKVSIKNCSEELMAIDISGHKINTLLADQFTKIPVNDWQVVTENNLTLINLSFGQPVEQSRFKVVGTVETVSKLANDLQSKQVLISDSALWPQLDIQAGLPSVNLLTYEDFIPQMVNLELLDAINFKKGCYTGQEIIARMHYLGKPKRLMYKILCENLTDRKQPIGAGDDLYSPDSKSSQGAGKIVATCALDENKWIALAVIEINTMKKDSVYLDDAYTIKATITDLPYSMDIG